VALFTSVGAGPANWDAAATWDDGVLTPGPGDSATIAAGHTVTGNVAHTISAACAVTADAGGTLNISNGVTFSISTGGVVDVSGACNLSGELSNVVGGGTVTIYNGGELTALAGSTWSMPAGSIVDVQAGGKLDLNIDPVTLAGAWSGAGDIECESRLTIDAGADFSAMILSGGTLTLDFGVVADATLTTNGVVLPNIVVANNGITTCTLQDDLECLSFVETAGAFADDGNDGTVNGDLLLTGGVFISTGTWTTAIDADLEADDATRAIGKLVVPAGVFMARSGTVYVHAIDCRGTLDNAELLCVYRPTVNDFFRYDGPMVDGTVSVELDASRSNSLDVNLGAKALSFTSSDDTWTQSGRLTAGAVAISGVGVGEVATLDMTSGALSCGAVTLGIAASDRSGALLLGEGAHSIASLVSADALNLANAIALENCYLEASGVLNFDNIAHTATAEVVHINCLAGSYVSNFDPTTAVHVHGDADVDNDSGGGAGVNNGVNGVTTFNAERMPWALTMGVT